MIPMKIAAMMLPIMRVRIPARGLLTQSCSGRRRADPSEWAVARPTPRGACEAVSLADPVILTCAISGAIADRDQCPAIPYTPEEYGAEARLIVDEGGVMIHIHARRPDGTPSYAVEDFRAITEAIRTE